MKMVKSVIYLRTSSDRQIDNTSLDTQETICKSYCEREGWEVIDVVRKEAVSAKETNVQRVAEMLDYAKENKGKFQVLVVWKLDRFSRSQEQHHWLRGQLQRLDIVLRSATERIDETPSGRLIEGVLAAVNEYDNKIRGERTKIALWKLVSDGIWPWKAPYGYRPKEVGVKKAAPYVFDDNCSRAVKEIFERYATGTTTKAELAAEFNKKQNKSYKGRIIKLWPQAIDRMFRNVYYCGLLKDKDGKLIKAQHQPLINASVFEKCQTVQEKISNHATRARSHNNPDFVLRKFTYCGFCNSPLTACWSKGKMGTKYPYYYCRNKICQKYGKMAPRETLHNQFFEYLEKIKPKEKFINLFKETFIERYQQRKQEIKGEYLGQLKEIEELEGEQGWLVERGRKGVIPDRILQHSLEELEQKITLAKMNLTETHKEELEVEALLNYALAFIRTPHLAWYDAKFEHRLKLQRLIFPEGIKYHFEGLSNSRLSLPFKLIGDFATASEQKVGKGRVELPRPKVTRF